MNTSVDDISTNILKKISGVIYEPLAHVINKSIKNDVFPDLLKKAKIIPIFKKGEAQDPNNYRPIALLSPLAKIFEKLMKYRLTSFLEKIKFFSKFQFGFLKDRSTEEAVAATHIFINDALDDDCLAATLFFDIKKAFDTLNHEILFKNLKIRE